jgi:hypothetical protein
MNAKKLSLNEIWRVSCMELAFFALCFHQLFYLCSIRVTLFESVQIAWCALFRSLAPRQARRVRAIQRPAVVVEGELVQFG